jgi:type 1 fimbriae regulatory protein FimB/type 1 fimbriae regulatory protein FimE
MTKLRLVRAAKSAKFEPPLRKRNAETRSREYLTLAEVKKVRDAARSAGRNGHRDGLMVLMLFRHGLRVAELVAMTWDEIHFDDGTLLVRRVKNGRESRHFLEGDEIRQLKQLQRESLASRFVFCSERDGPLSNRSVHHIVQKAGEVAKLPFSIHPHMLRHAKGFQLAQSGTDTRAIQGYLGHRDIKSTVIYTELDPSRFKGFGKDI